MSDSEAVNASLATLKKQRATSKKNISRIKNLLDNSAMAWNPIDLECRLDILSSYIKQIMAYQTEIERSDETDDRRAEIEELCISTKTKLLTLLGRNRPRDHSMMETTMTALLPPANRLPTLRLPKFDGKYAAYKNFISSFNNLVNDEPTLTAIEKFNHLLTCLSGDALRTVSAFQVTEDNYVKALNRLAERYDKKCLIVFDSIDQLFAIPKMAKPDASALRNAVDTVSAVYDSLQSIGSEKDIANALLIHLVLSKVDFATKSKWNDQLDYCKLPSWSECSRVLIRRCQSLEINEEKSVATDHYPRSSKINPQRFEKKKDTRSSFSCSSSSNENKCIHCNSNGHAIHSCDTFSSLAVEERFEFAKKTSLCINCLRQGHSVSSCKSQRCRVCQRPHHTLLHRYATSTVVSTNLTSNKRPNSTQQSSLHVANEDNVVILATAVVKIRDRFGNYQLARALLDSGSQVNFICEDTAKRLQLKREGNGVNLIGIGEINAAVKHRVNTSVASRINSYEFNADFWIMPSISSCKPEENLAIGSWNIPKNIKLADPNFYKKQKVDLLLGADVFFELLSVGQIKMTDALPTLQKTLFGWIVSGKYSPSHSSNQVCHLSSISEELETSLDAIVRKFWECEEIPDKKGKFSEEHECCEAKFVETTKLLSSGRFEVRLPFKEQPASLGYSFETAKRRFLALERRLARTPDVQKLYNDFMKEYLSLGHMSRTRNKIPDQPHYFIPHQCVVRPQSTTTKLRVVFDASCKTSTQKSLNDILMVGPTIQPDLYMTLLRFRCRRFAITADITKMYRQVQVHESDRQYQLILWRENDNMPLEMYQLNTVTYGTSPAPFLAIRCLKQLGDTCIESHPLGSRVIREDFYVDDMMSGADTFGELEQIRKEIVEVLGRAGFCLAKWYSNHAHFHGNDNTNKPLQFNDSDEMKALGISWNPKKDTLHFRFENDCSALKATKRNILSTAARLFDPLGLLCPFVTKAKILLQELWVQKLHWDESIPMHLNSSWEEFVDNLVLIPLITIPRFVHSSQRARIQIHGFADASMRAYGCCFYIRSVENNVVSSRLLTAKSKVAPLKTKTLPRLELCAAHLMAKLWQTIEPIFKTQVEQVVFWSDSEIILHWIKTHPSLLTTFVANRIAEIQEFTSMATWRHVPTKCNPADIASRGCNVTELTESIWFNGPQFLMKKPEDWPVNSHFDLSSVDASLERKKKKTVLVAVEQEPNTLLQLIERISSYKKIIRIVAYLYRFIKGTSETTVIITSKEWEWSFLKIVETIQRHAFSLEIAALTKNTDIKSSIERLNPFIHALEDTNRKFSLLRVGGRLGNAPLSYDTKFPLLLPKNEKFVHLYLQHLHVKNCHAGPKILIGLLRQRIWLINARDMTRKIVRNCIHCFKYKPKLLNQIMGNLPYDSLRSLRPFLICGVDFCGPFNTSYRIRGRPPYKTYVAIFVCFTSKAVHIEPVSDLSTNTFIIVLKRFIGRRGLPEKIYCDNATNFVGANARLKEFRQQFFSTKAQEQLQNYTAEEAVQFVFIPPRSPHFGGLWEAAVKSTKGLLTRTVASTILTFEELSTVLVEIEAILNSRPIAPISEDPNDGEALSPAHLLIGCSLKALPDVKSTGETLAYSKRWHLISALKTQFWSTLQRDFILEQQQRAKWATPRRNIEVSAIVIIHDDNLPPQKWVTGRIVATVKGADGNVRVAAIRTTNGVLRRAIHKLAPLPMTDQR